jgi:hypothetical protein
MTSNARCSQSLVAEVTLRFHRLAVENLLSFYLQSPKQALIAAALLEYRPSLMDILPMYIVFMLLTLLREKSLAAWVGKRFFLSAS